MQWLVSRMISPCGSTISTQGFLQAAHRKERLKNCVVAFHCFRLEVIYVTSAHNSLSKIIHIGWPGSKGAEKCGLLCAQKDMVNQQHPLPHSHYLSANNAAGSQKVEAMFPRLSSRAWIRTAVCLAPKHVLFCFFVLFCLVLLSTTASYHLVEPFLWELLTKVFISKWHALNGAILMPYLKPILREWALSHIWTPLT